MTRIITPAYQLEYTETYKRADGSLHRRARSVAWDDKGCGVPTSANIGRWIELYLANLAAGAGDADTNAVCKSVPAVTQGWVILRRTGELVASWSGFRTPKI